MSRDELRWKDQHLDHGGVVGYAEMRLEQPDAPADAVALVEAGHLDHEHPGETVADAAYLTAEQAVEAALILLESAERWRCEQRPEDAPRGPTDDRELRWRLHVCACSIEDMTFWVERVGSGWRATEVETGVSGQPAFTEREAMENYWRGDFA
jgi:hypothetical protein